MVAFNREEVLSLLDNFAKVLPENNYWAFSTYTMTAPYILTKLHESFPPKTQMLAPAWAYMGVACMAIIGIGQLTDQNNHRPIVNKIKGSIMIATSVQLAVLTALGLGGPAGAITFGVCFGLTLDDTIRAIRRTKNEAYLLKDNFAQLKKITRQIKKLEQNIEKLNEKIATMIHDNLRTKVRRRLTDIKKYQEKCLNKHKATQSDLEKDVYTILALKKANLENIDKYISTIDWSENYKLSLVNEMAKVAPLALLPDCIKRKAQITEKNHQAIKQALSENVIWGTAFLGLLFACIPGMEIVGIIFVIMASALFFLKNSNKIKNKAHTFFYPKKESPQQAAITEVVATDNVFDEDLQLSMATHKL